MSTVARITRGGVPAQLQSASAADNGTIDVMDVFRVLRRRKWLIVTIVLIGTLAATLYGLQRTPVYTAQSVVLIDPQKNSVVDIQSALAGLTSDQATMGTQIRLFQSRTFQARVMEDLHLFDDPEFNPALAEEQPEPDQGGARGAVGTAPGADPAGMADDARPRPGAGDGAGERGARGSRARRRSTISPRNLESPRAMAITYVLTISFTSARPEKAALIANRIGRDLCRRPAEEQALRHRPGLDLARRAAAHPARTSAQSRARRSSATGRRTIWSSAEACFLSDQELSDLNKELIQAKADLAERQAKLGLVRALRGPRPGAVDAHRRRDERRR